MQVRRTRSALLAVVVAVLAAALGATPASAGLLVKDAPDCESPASAPVFRPWLDPASYFLAPDGGFEAGGDGWTLRDGAAVVDDNSSYAVSGPGSHALALPSGSGATSPVVCVGLEHPTIRFFARKTAGSGLLGLLDTLRVDVLVEDNLGLISALPIGVVTSSSSWQPTLPMLVTASLLPLLPGSHTPVAFRFVPQGGDWVIDDVHVDPYGGH